MSHSFEVQNGLGGPSPHGEVNFKVIDMKETEVGRGTWLLTHYGGITGHFIYCPESVTSPNLTARKVG